MQTCRGHPFCYIQYVPAPALCLPTNCVLTAKANTSHGHDVFGHHEPDVTPDLRRGSIIYRHPECPYPRRTPKLAEGKIGPTTTPALFGVFLEPRITDAQLHLFFENYMTCRN